MRENRFAEENGHTSIEIGWDDIQTYVDEAIAELPERLRWPVVAHYLEGQTYHTIAGSLGVPRSTVASRVQKGLDVVRKSLKKRGIPVTSGVLSGLLAANASEAAPAALTAALGKLAIAGTGKVTLTAAAATLGGLILMKKVVVAGAIVAAAAFGVWTASERLIEEDTQSQETPAIQAAQTPNTPDEAWLEPEDIVAEPNMDEEPGESPRAVETTDEPTDEEEPPVFGGTVSGHIFDAKTGEGIEGVRALVFPQGGDSSQGQSIESDADGRYRVIELPDGSYRVSVHFVDGYPDPRGAGSVVVTVTDGQTVKGIDFAIEKGVRIAGAVLSVDGEPVEGARVGAMTEGMPGAEHTKSEENGSFEVFLPMPGPSLVLQAKTDRFESDVLGPLVLTDQGLDGLVLRLTAARAASISGTVVDHDDRPVEGVGLHMSRGRPSLLLVGGDSAKSLADGSFSITELAAGSYGIRTSPPRGGGGSTADKVMDVALSEGEALTDVRIVFREDKGGLAIAGRVTDTQGNPIVGVEVMAGGPTHEIVRCEEDGTFRITGLREGTYDLSAFDNRLYSPAHIRAVRAGSDDLHIVMHGQGAIEGRVLRADTGEPVTEFELFLYFGIAGTHFLPRLLMNGREVHHPEGRFTRENVYVGDVTLTARAPGLAPSFQIVSVAEHETVKDVVFSLEPADRIEGSVVTAAGDPVSGALIFLGRIPTRPQIQDQAVARTGADGRFSIDSPPPNIITIAAYHPSHAPGSATISRDTVIVLPEAGVLEGTVTYGGQPVPTAAVHAAYPSERYMPFSNTETGNEGTYRFAGLSPGTIQVRVQIKGKNRTQTCDAIIESGQRTVVDFEFRPGTSVVEGQITVDGAPVESGRVYMTVLTAGGKESFNGAAKPGGSYRLENLPAGQALLKVQVPAQAGETRSRFEEFELGESETVRLDVDFSGRGAIAGRLIGFNDSLFGAVMLLEGEVSVPSEPSFTFFYELEDYTLRQTECAADGTFEIGKLDVGTYTVVAITVPRDNDDDPSQTRVASSVVTINEEDSVSLDFDFR